MVARQFGVDMHVVTGDAAVARNLMLVVERCHLEVEAMVARPYVAGLSVLADDEADLGAAVVDMGAGTTTMAVFSGGRFVHADGLRARRAAHHDGYRARALSARIADAERIKTLYGTVLTGGSDERDMMSVPPVGDDDARSAADRVPRDASRNIIKPRVEEILEMVRDRLAGFAVRGRAARPRRAHRRRQPAHRPRRNSRRGFSAGPVRIGRPLGFGRLPDAAKSAGLRGRRPACWSIRRSRISNMSNRGKRGS